jgi:hypothetical protein
VDNQNPKKIPTPGREGVIFRKIALLAAPFRIALLGPRGHPYAHLKVSCDPPHVSSVKTQQITNLDTYFLFKID